jgi:hypothetical protein
VLLVELRCLERLANDHTAQCLNYLRVSGQVTPESPGKATQWIETIGFAGKAENAA